MLVRAHRKLLKCFPNISSLCNIPYTPPACSRDMVTPHIRLYEWCGTPAVRSSLTMRGASVTTPLVRLIAQIEGFLGVFSISLFVFTLTRAIHR